MKLTLTRQEATTIILQHLGMVEGVPVQLEIVDTFPGLVQMFREIVSPYCDKVGQLADGEVLEAAKSVRTQFEISYPQAEYAVQNIDSTLNFLATHGRFPTLTEII